MLDSAHLQEADADYLNRHGLSRHQPALPLYTVADAQRAIAALRPVDFDTATDLPGGCGVQLTPAGHILGAAIVQIRHPGGRLVFSGDLGRYGDPLMPPPGGGASRSSDRRVHLWQPQAQRGAGGRRVGSRHHAHGQARRHRGDTRVRGRAQALLYYIWQLKQAGRIARDLPVFLDSPMASGAVDYLRHAGDQRLSAADARAAFGVATYVTEVEQSKALDSSPMPKIIVSASGMATGGRVIHHLKHYLPDPRSTVLFAGFRPRARAARRCWTAPPRSRSMAAGARAPEIDSLPMLSAHADADEILRWLRGFERAPRETFIVHGEPGAADALRLRIKDELGWRCRAVEQNDVAELG